MQRNVGNRAVTRMLTATTAARDPRALDRCPGRCTCGGGCGKSILDVEEEGSDRLRLAVLSRSLSHALHHPGGQASRQRPSRVEPRADSALLQRQTTSSSCAGLDLRGDVSAADAMARQMVALAISAVPSSGSTGLFKKWFVGNGLDPTDLSTVIGVYQKINAGFAANKYSYACEVNCDTGDEAYSYAQWVSETIHLCFNNYPWTDSGLIDCKAATIVHELSHLYAGTKDVSNCIGGCNYMYGCTHATKDDALNNASSYEGFAHDAYAGQQSSAAAASTGSLDASGGDVAASASNATGTPTSYGDAGGGGAVDTGSGAAYDADNQSNADDTGDVAA
jgi:Lysine-specific metallo-endopeptidase